MSARVTVVGNLTRDPELRYTPSGTAVTNFSVASNKKWTGKDGEVHEEVAFFEVSIWNKLAENVAESLAKGTRVIVDGILKQRSWETNEGQKRTVIEIEGYSVGPDLSFATATVERNERTHREES